MKPPRFDLPNAVKAEVIVKIEFADGRVNHYRFPGIDLVSPFLRENDCRGVESPSVTFNADYSERRQRYWPDEITVNDPVVLDLRVTGKPIPNDRGHWLTVHTYLPEDA